MNKISNKIVFTFLVLVGITSCQKVIDVDVSEMEGKIIIEGNYDATNEIVEVIISETKNVFGTSQFVFLDGAQVEIENQNGETEQLTALGNGKYLLTDYAPEFLSTYNITVNYDGESYSSSAFLPEVVPIDTVVSIYDEGSLFAEEGYVVFFGFEDPVGPNFYRAMRIVNEDTITEQGEQFIFDDSFSEGNYQQVPFFSSRYEVEDTITVELRSYSEDAYKFYIDLYGIAGDDGQSAAPANPTSSWTNGAFGHFAAWGFDRRTVIVEE